MTVLLSCTITGRSALPHATIPSVGRDGSQVLPAGEYFAGDKGADGVFRGTIGPVQESSIR
jgi:hypothetical protein